MRHGLYNAQVKNTIALSRVPLILLGVATLALGIASFFLWDAHRSLGRVRAESEAARASSADLETRLREAETRTAELRSLLEQAAAENSAFAARVNELAGSVTLLDKIFKTDEELLQKYSSVYFLNENYVPENLVPINDELLARAGSNLMFHGGAFPYLEKMMRAAAQDEKPLRVLSSYRSFGEQSSLKSSYKRKYGTGANAFSADQGYSEHQLATTVDFTTAGNPESLALFGTSEQYSWLVRHAHEYGFVLSYPKDNTFFQFEPWHWRFVGVALATRLYHDNKFFYDLDQREIDLYRSRIFD